jgi:guanylate kinase
VSRGRLIVVAGPSGVGKGSVVQALLRLIPEGLSRSVSATTRPPRVTETDGDEYFFVSNEAFDAMIHDGELLEWAEVFGGHRYGTPTGFVERERGAGRDVVLEIDVQGAAQIKDRVEDALLILLEPPSVDQLERRLRGRATETEASIAERLSSAGWELAQGAWFDHVVVNDDVERAAGEVAAIIERSRAVPEDR